MSVMDPYNLPLLRKERDWVAEQLAKPARDRELNMGSWRGFHSGCGTTYCLAGHVVEHMPGIEWCGRGIVIKGGRPCAVSEVARQELGLTAVEAFRLFFVPDECVLDVLDNIIATAEAVDRYE